MNKQYQLKKKRLAKETENDDEQIEKTLNFFDAIIDQYLNDENDRVNTSSNAPISQMRRFTSETSLNQISASSRSRPVQTTDDLSTIPSEKRPSNLVRKINELSANGASASLIDLSSIDKSSSRPRFRFVPSANANQALQEEQEIDQQFHIKTIPNQQKPAEPPLKPSHQIVKPIVIIPSVPKFTPINRLAETNIHHQNGNSAFKPHKSTKTGVSSKIQQIKQTESIQKPHVHIGITNPDLLSRQKSTPQFHQSMLNLSSPEVPSTNRYAPRISYDANARHPTRSSIHDNPIVRRIQQVNNTSSITGLVHPEQRSQLPYGSYISPNAGIMNNPRQQTYHNPPKHHSFQHPLPAQSVYSAAPAVTRTAVFSPSSSFNVYNFNRKQSPRTRQSTHRPNLPTTTYL